MFSRPTVGLTLPSAPTPAPSPSPRTAAGAARCSRHWRQVEHRGGAALRVGQHGARWRDGRCRPAVFSTIARHRHQRAGIAGRDAGLRLAVLDLLIATRIDESFFRRRATSTGRPSRRLRWPATTRGARMLAAGASASARADQQQLRVGMRVPGNAGRPASVTRRAVVAAHAVDGQSSHGLNCRANGIQRPDAARSRTKARHCAAQPGLGAVQRTIRLRSWSSAPCGRGRSRSG